MQCLWFKVKLMKRWRVTTTHHWNALPGYTAQACTHWIRAQR